MKTAKPAFAAILLVLSMLFISCQSNGLSPWSSGEEQTITVDHYYDTAVGMDPTIVLRIKENDSQNWNYRYGGIKDFNYESGYVYRLKVLVKEIKDPPMDGSGREITLIELISKTKVPAETDFTIRLRDRDIQWIYADGANYFINPTIKLGFASALVKSQLQAALANRSYKKIEGVFKHSPNSTDYILQKVITK